MIRIQKVLVPTDFSETSRGAVNYGLSLALQYEARLVLCHVVPATAMLATAFPAESFSIESDQLAQVQLELPSLIPETSRGRVGLRIVTRIGRVMDELLAIIDEEEPDVVVMGTHGRSGAERLFLGSTTERLLRKSPVPVLTVSRQESADPATAGLPRALHRIVYATDFSPHSDSGLRAAAELARAARAELVILHVLQNFDIGYFGKARSIILYSASQIDSWRQQALDSLEDAVASVRDSVDVKSVMASGTPAQVILRVAADRDADLIVINLHGKGFLDRALLGSTAERVIRMSPIPVLAIPQRDDDRLPAMTVAEQPAKVEELICEIN